MWTKEQRREYQREYDKRRYYEDEAYREKKRQYYLQHKRERAMYNNEYRKKNADKIREYQREYHRKQRQNGNDGRGKEK